MAIQLVNYIRNYKDEVDIILAFLVEYFLMNNLKRLHEFLPGARRTANNEFSLCGGQYKIRFERPLADSYPEVKTQAEPFDIQAGVMPVIYQSMGLNQRKINAHWITGSLFWSRMCDFEFRMSNPSVSSFDERDIKKARELGGWLGIKSGWTAMPNFNDMKWSLALHPTNPSAENNSEIIEVRDIDGNYKYSLQIFHLDESKYYVLPVSYFKLQSIGTKQKLFIPPSQPYTLMNSDQLAEYPDAEVYLTDDVMLTKKNPPSQKRIFLCNPGRKAWIDKLDLKCLHNRDVTIVVKSDSSDCSELVLAEHLIKVDKTPKIVTI